ncbi:MAG: Rrf2 family transcriptional regulator [FCB group bacterium]|nr:Rrf2 family transcriptional regulator [FCB group bacterium]
MLKLTRKVEYSLIALRHMQNAGHEAVCSARVIAERYGIPYDLLAKILQLLARESIITAVQGPKGGYRINARLGDISLIDFFELIEGPVGISDCNLDEDCDRDSICNIRKPITRINNNIRSVFSNITLDDVTL